MNNGDLLKKLGVEATPENLAIAYEYMEPWGVGSKADQPAYDMVLIGRAGEEERCDLFFGQFPHTRQDDRSYVRMGKSIYGFNGARPLIDITFNEENYLKSSGLSGGEIRNFGTCKIYFNRKPVYEFHYRKTHHALIEAYGYIDKLLIHPLELWREDWDTRCIGKEVMWKDSPCIITYVIAHQGAVVLQPKDPADPVLRRIGETDIKDDIFSPMIRWYLTTEPL